MSRKTPIRAGLLANSALQPLVEDGIQAVERGHLDYIERDLRPTFDDSLNIDDAFHEGREQENRWDYLLGHGGTRELVGVEPHSASNKEVSVVIRKRERALEQLRPHLRPGVFVADWFWIASGNVDFMPMEKAVNRLANNGIKFVGKRLLAKSLGERAPPKRRRAGQ